MAEPHESRVYSDFARFYDLVFGRAFLDREHAVVESLNLRPGNRVLEVGVGTGISLGAYPPYVHVVGIDPSQDMLAQASAKARENEWGHIELRQGDALHLDFPDDSFDDVTSFHVMTVVPDPVRMMSEMVRVCKPGGRIVIVNHFASEHPLLFFFGKLVTPITKVFGWTARLRARDVLKNQNMRLERFERFSRFSVHFLLVARKHA
jgi:phosphatidylethanolamine/phosphatidyl-N-methylethanolamine N-methyltransferase